jgi:non-heme chloroperoxidase
MGRHHPPGRTEAAMRPVARAGRATLPDGAVLHYVEQGQGDGLVLLHGGMGDLHTWQSHLPLLAQRFRTLAFSRRYAYPNANGPPEPDYGAWQDAQDLASFLQVVRTGPCHLVGSSYGALVALVFALTHPAQVRSLCLFEPPLHAWARRHPVGKQLYEAFMQRAWRPAQEAFEAGAWAAGLELLMAGMGNDTSAFAGAPDVAMRNANAMHALTASIDPFPDVSRAAVARLQIPVLLLRGERANAIHRFALDELALALPAAARGVLPAAGHSAPFKHPRSFTAALLRFLRHCAIPTQSNNLHHA